MGTRCLTVVKSRWDDDEEWSTDATIFRHWDGYPDGQGQTLFAFLDGLALVNGICLGGMPERFANGSGRLAAQLIVRMQEEGHDPDLMSAEAICGQEWEYHVLCDQKRLSIGVVVFAGPVECFGMGGENCTTEVFRGTVAEFGEWLVKQVVEA